MSERSRASLVTGALDRRAFVRLATLASSSLAFVSTVAACGDDSGSGAGKPKGVRIGFTHPAAQAGVVAVLAKYATAKMKSIGGEFTVGALANATPDAQFNLIEGWINQKYDAIEVFPLDAASLAPLQKRAQAAGIKWITYLTPMEGDDGTVGPSPEAQGKLLAEGLTQWMEKTGKGSKALVLAFSPLPDISARVDLAVDAAKAAGVEIVSTQDSVDAISAQEITENTLSAHPDLDMVICLADDAAGGAVTAFKNAKKNTADCFIGGCDGTQEVLEDLLADTCYKATSAIDVRQFGEALVTQGIAVVESGTKPTPTPGTLLTKDTDDSTKEFLANFAKA